MRKMPFLPIVLALPGCADLSDTGRSTATGAGLGALIGAGVGGTGGYLVGRSRTNR